MGNLRRPALIRFCSALLSAALLGGCGGARGVQSLPNQPAFAPGYLHAAATPTHWYVEVGADSHKGVLESLDFYTNFITIDAGDSITWKFRASVHTVSFLTPKMNVYTASKAPAGGSTEDGSTFTSSGVVGPGASYTLTFPKAGTYNYNCLLHPPEMAGTVVVNPAGKPYPHTQSYYNGYAKADAAADLGAAVAAVKAFPYKNGGPTLVAGIAPGLATGPPVQPTVYAFLDADRLDATTVTVKVGTVVTWVNQANQEPHTITFPVAGKPLPKKLAANPFSPPSGGFTYDGKHVTNSGPIGPGYLGFGTLSYSLKFTKPGTYVYYCLFHFPFGMIGKVVVTT